MSNTVPDIIRRMDNLLCFGSIAEVDDKRQVRIDIAGRLTDWRPVPDDIGQNFRRHRPVRVGTQVLLGCPFGDPAQAVILAFLYHDGRPSPSDLPTIDETVFDDGTVIRHDAEAKRMEMSNPDGTLVLDFKNIVIRTRDGGYYHLDHAGMASRLTHIEDNRFESENWVAGSVTTGKPDHGFSPPTVKTEDEVT